MKTALTGLALLAGAYAVHAQGTVSIENYLALSPYIYVYYKPLSGPLVPLGGSNKGPTPTLVNYASEVTNGNQWTVQIWGVAGSNQTSGLAPLAGATATFANGSFWDATPGTWASSAIGTVPGTEGNSVATVQLYVWYNAGGQISNYNQALSLGACFENGGF